ncbi:hypothetical protein GCM10007422_44340 [Pedobacter zeae]|uniref:Uncharacterized protein n=1 Tax=Pedobacter zeae TaxID=1737356 RepID=A0ABQ1YCQ1_9SPHI|nr:hypothetical protein GCM10007422_44340 [Pedobacter zeae]
METAAHDCKSGLQCTAGLTLSGKATIAFQKNSIRKTVFNLVTEQFKGKAINNLHSTFLA